MEAPLLPAKDRSKQNPSYQHVGREGSLYPIIASPETQLSIEEIRSATPFSSYPPPSDHPAFLGSIRPESSGQFSKQHINNLTQAGRFILDEVEIRELLLNHVGQQCCWGTRPARTWKICAVEDCNVYVGTLETFIEQRETRTQTEPYHGGLVDGEESGPPVEVWEMDLSSEFPLLFVPHKALSTKLPHSESVEKCSSCVGRGRIPCSTCNAEQEPGFYKENQMIYCFVCYGRGLTAHGDGSDRICMNCNGKGKLPCSTCGSTGLVNCETCRGEGSLITCKIVMTTWRTLSARKVSACSGAASVPDEVFHRAKGIQLYNTQAYQCSPAFFADSFLLNKFSSDVIADRPPVPLTARVICERHMVFVVPVTRVTMVHRKKFFTFYIIGLGREVYIKDYPSKFCWGLCPCFEWLRMW